MWKGVLYTSDIGELSGYYAKFCSLNLMARAIFPSDVNIVLLIYCALSYDLSGFDYGFLYDS